MPANYSVVEAEKTADKPDRGYGPMQTIRLRLLNEKGNERGGIQWYTKASTPVPEAGAQLFGDVKEGQYGWEFKKVQTGGGGGKSFKADPEKLEVEREKNRAIASEAAHRVAVDTIRLAIEIGNMDPESPFRDPSILAKRIVEVGRVLFDDTMGRIK